jgi:hypothetical protein
LETPVKIYTINSISLSILPGRKRSYSVWNYDAFRLGVAKPFGINNLNIEFLFCLLIVVKCLDCLKIVIPVISYPQLMVLFRSISACCNSLNYPGPLPYYKVKRGDATILVLLPAYSLHRTCLTTLAFNYAAFPLFTMLNELSR